MGCYAEAADTPGHSQGVTRMNKAQQKRAVAMPVNRAGWILMALALATAATSASHAEETLFDGLSKMVTDGKASVNFRYRFEYVDDDALDEEAEASLLRSRLTLASAEYKGVSALFLSHQEF